MRTMHPTVVYPTTKNHGLIRWIQKPDRLALCVDACIAKKCFKRETLFSVFLPRRVESLTLRLLHLRSLTGSAIRRVEANRRALSGTA